jgi:iron complex outermembrane receptor protein
MGSAAFVALALVAGSAQAQDRITIAPQPLDTALNELGARTGQQVLIRSDVTLGKMTRGVTDSPNFEMALNSMLAGTGLTYRHEGDTWLITKATADPQGGSAGAEVEGLIVTAQKREENIQDVPIAMSAFSQETLTERQVAGGPDLITQIPNMSFTKTNFTSYSIQIRGIGTQAISATTDPAVAVAFNNTPFIRNRFFEQEFYDLERLEVLRGPQGTLYGRNATAGVVNLISAKPKFTYSAKVSADLGNYANQRLEGMVNIPLVEDVVALRLAGAMTKREGYAFNQMTGTPIDGRDLWSTRVSLRFEPTDWISANFIWEHFQEDDDRLRSGKQLCKKDPGPTEIDGLTVPGQIGGFFGITTYISQGCLPGSLYSAEAFQTPNGFALPFYGPTGNIGNPVKTDTDPYASATQSRNLRVIESSVEPEYRAKSDIAELQFAIDLSDTLTLSSETAYSTDELFSLQDYNRFTTAAEAFAPNGPGGPESVASGILSPSGVFCDPQLGCSDRLLLVDLSTSDSTQFSQEFRLASDYDGPINFSFGVNYLRHDAIDKYYVFINSMTMFAAWGSHNYDPNGYVAGVSDNEFCLGGPGASGNTAAIPATDIRYQFGVASACMYIDPNSIGSLDDEGRNYFLSKNPYKLISYATFGELYYNVTPELKFTAGLRFTVDKKQAPQIPSWLLASLPAGPYPVARTVDQEWREPTGRLALDWQPELGFTDQTLVYASYAHGYKAGGANPPPPVLVTYGEGTGIEQEIIPDVFGPEFVDAFEIGAKNTLLDGAITLNLTAFYYDYEGYQTSEIRNRSAVNSNFDARIWGAELEADWRATDALRLGFKGGYNKTRMADGSNAIDLMDRTAGDTDWIVVRPFPTMPSNCIIPAYVAAAGGQFNFNESGNGLCVVAYYDHLDPITGRAYDPSITDYSMALDFTGVPLGAAYAGYPGWDPTTAPNGGQGISKDLSGNELPNAPNYTATLTADYTMPLRGDWQVTMHGDYHYQSESWGRVINNDPYDRIEAFSTVNAAATFTNEGAGWKVMAYVKNVFDETAITGTFLNSDDTGLTTNVFLTEPRLYGIRVTKDWTGAGGLWWGGERNGPGEPYRVTMELGGGLSQFSGEAETYRPDFLETFSPMLSFPLGIQDGDLDWGDTRSVKLTYAPNSNWQISAAQRFGKTNGHERGASYEAVAGGYETFCFFGSCVVRYYDALDNFGRSATDDSEEHAITDFMVGRNMDFGSFGTKVKSTFGAGVRHAEMKSSSVIAATGMPDNDVLPMFNVGQGDQTYTYFSTTLTSARGFKGWGPSLTWDASVQLFGDDERGRINLDWSAAGGVLFGKRNVENVEERLGEYVVGGFVGQAVLDYRDPAFKTITTLYDDTLTVQREEDVSIPNLSLSVGLSYSIDRVKVSTGYSYDRFFDAIDGGYTEAQAFDRTIHGPYLKLSLGFGG